MHNIAQVTSILKFFMHWLLPCYVNNALALEGYMIHSSRYRTLLSERIQILASYRSGELTTVLLTLQWRMKAV